MGQKIYNTLTRTIENFETVEPGKVRLYVCGPTVYNKAHIGHAMSALVFDIIRRYLEYRGYEVNHVMNFTDVDDKIIKRANELGMDPFALGKQYIDEYKKHIADLNILPPTITPYATREIDQIVDMIQGLMNKGYAYEVDGDVYFRVEKDKDYGKLSGRRIEDMQSGSRIEIDDRKESPIDFALWKAARAGEPSWETPWGQGRPGWHIECSAMSRHHLGDEIDIHGGGNDLVFPHHENEIAQTECLTEKTFARYWVHHGMLQLSGEKMSKSIGNLITVEEYLEKHSANSFRMLILNSYYRNPLTYNEDIVEQAEKGIDRLRSALKPELPGVKGAPAASLAVLEQQTESARNGFIEAMDNDFNSAGALGNLFDLVRVVNQTRADGATSQQLLPAQQLLLELTGVLGLQLEEENQGKQAADPFIDLLVEVRLELRKQKQFALSDLIRDRLTGLGVTLEDSKEGTTWHW